MIELVFPILGDQIPADHGYALYGALARVLPVLHEAGSPILIGPIAGDSLGRGLLHLTPRRSRLRLRLPAESIPTVLPIAGKQLDVAGHRLRLGVPQVRSLVPAANLIARMVTIKKSDRADPPGTKAYMEPAAFLEGVRNELTRLEIVGEPAIPLVRSGPHAGQPARRTLRIHGRQVVGFAVQVTGLTAEESVRLQACALGGRRKMGAGFFVPMRLRESGS